jgi:hypothetical protein
MPFVVRSFPISTSSPVNLGCCYAAPRRIGLALFSSAFRRLVSSPTINPALPLLRQLLPFSSLIRNWKFLHSSPRPCRTGSPIITVLPFTRDFEPVLLRASPSPFFAAGIIKTQPAGLNSQPLNHDVRHRASRAVLQLSAGFKDPVQIQTNRIPSPPSRTRTSVLRSVLSPQWCTNLIYQRIPPPTKFREKSLS